MLGTVDYLDIYQSPGWQRQKLWDYADLGNEPIKWSATTTSTSLEMITNNIFSCFARLSHAWSWLSFFLICWRCAAVCLAYLVPAFLPASYPAPPPWWHQVNTKSTFPDTQYSVISPPPAPLSLNSPSPEFGREPEQFTWCHHCPPISQIISFSS